MKKIILIVIITAIISSAVTAALIKYAYQSPKPGAVQSGTPDDTARALAENTRLKSELTDAQMKITSLSKQCRDLTAENIQQKQAIKTDRATLELMQMFQSGLSGKMDDATRASSSAKNPDQPDNNAQTDDNADAHVTYLIFNFQENVKHRVAEQKKSLNLTDEQARLLDEYTIAAIKEEVAIGVKAVNEEIDKADGRNQIKNIDAGMENQIKQMFSESQYQNYCKSTEESHKSNANSNTDYVLKQISACVKNLSAEDKEKIKSIVKPEREERANSNLGLFYNLLFDGAISEKNVSQIKALLAPEQIRDFEVAVKNMNDWSETENQYFRRKKQ